MPSQISHILHGRAAAEALPQAFRGSLNDAAFRLGCQGPDIFYHNRRTKPGAFLYGTRLHSRGYGAVSALMMARARERAWGPEHPGTAFLAGWLTHAVLDREAHPFVVYFSGWAVPGQPETAVLRRSHAFLERTLDVLLYQHLTGLPFSSCDLQSGLPGPEQFPEDFYEVWGASLAEVFPHLSVRAEVTRRLKNAVGDAAGFLGFTDPQNQENARRAAGQGHVQYFHPIVLPNWDFGNQGGIPWRHPVSGEPRTDGFLDIFDRAVDKARLLLKNWDDADADWEALVGNESLNLPDETGQSQAPRWSAPWDFQTFYELQRRAHRS